MSCLSRSDLTPIAVVQDQVDHEGSSQDGRHPMNVRQIVHSCILLLLLTQIVVC